MSKPTELKTCLWCRAFLPSKPHFPFCGPAHQKLYGELGVTACSHCRAPLTPFKTHPMPGYVKFCSEACATQNRHVSAPWTKADEKAFMKKVAASAAEEAKDPAGHRRRLLELVRNSRNDMSLDEVQESMATLQEIVRLKREAQANAQKADTETVLGQPDQARALRATSAAQLAKALELERNGIQMAQTNKELQAASVQSELGHE